MYSLCPEAACLSRNSDDHVKWRSRLRIVSSITFVLNTLTFKFLFLTKLIHCRYRVIKDMFILLCFGLTCTFAYQAVEEERFLEQYLLSSFVIMQVSHVTIH